MTKDVRMKGFAQRVSVDHALEWIESFPLEQQSESVSLVDAAERVLAEDICAEVNVPGFRRAMMDGFAVIAADVLGADSYNPIPLDLISEIYAGQACDVDIQRGQAVQVMTGADIPASANAVVPVEFAERAPNGSSVNVLTSIAEQKHVAQIGEDICSGATVLDRGRILRPQDVAILASIGRGRINVVKRPDVRIIVTGNELLPVGEKPSGVQVVDSNSVMLQALIERDGGRPDFPGILRDDPDVIRNALESPADVILIAGGSSTGKEDHAPVLVRQLGELAIHGIAMRPSSPAGMGRIGNKPVFLLPGNPVSCLCAYDFFAGRIVRQLSGLAPDWPYTKCKLPLGEKITSQLGRTDYARVKILDKKVHPIAISGASILSSTIEADGFCIVPEQSEGYDIDSVVDVYLY